ncbi:hypothetical protein, partial [Desulfobacula sp.]|uniref:hypothetical protein n=1 Tax=Desulfobacula sp. TaxID=2593537 RepID=UPI0039B83BE8
RGKNLSRRREEYEENWLIIFFKGRKKKEENALSGQEGYSIFRSSLTYHPLHHNSAFDHELCCKFV